MKKLLYLLLLISGTASAQIPAANDTTLYSGSTAFTPQFRFKAVTLDGVSYRIPQVYNSLLGKYDTYITSKYLRAFYAPITGSTAYWQLNYPNVSSGQQTITDGTYGLQLGYLSTYGGLWAKGLVSKTTANAGLRLYNDGSTTLNAATGGVLEISYNDIPKISIDATNTYLANTVNLTTVGSGSTSNDILTLDGGVVKKIAGASYAPSVTYTSNTVYKGNGTTTPVVSNITDNGGLVTVGSPLSTTGNITAGSTGGQTAMSVSGDLSLMTGAGILYNGLYFGSGAFRYYGNTYGSFIAMNGNGVGDIDFITSPLNASGAGAAATITSRFAIKNNGNINIPILTASQLVATDASKNLVSVTALPIGTTASTPSGGTDVTNKDYVDARSLSGTYTPTITANVNVSSVNAVQCLYTRVGNNISVSGSFEATPTSATTASSVFLSVPVASDFGIYTNLQGFGQAYATSNITNIVAYGDFSTDQALIEFNSGASTSAQTIFFNFTYIVQ